MATSTSRRRHRRAGRRAGPARRLTAVLTMTAALVTGGLVRAQSAFPSASVPADDCDSANLLAGRTPWQWRDVRGDPALLTDGAIGPEGAEWNAPVAMVLADTGSASVTYDLGRPLPITAVYLQADANDTYRIESSLDGTPGSYQLLVEIDSALDRGHGLRARAVRLPSMRARYLRVAVTAGDGLYSLSELAAFCRAPLPFPPPFRQVLAPLAVAPVRPWYRLDWWQNDVSARLEMVLAALALLLLAWAAWVERTGRDVRLPPLAPRAVCALSLAIHLAIALALLVATDWLPGWAAFATFYLSCELTLLAARPTSDPATPLGLLLRRSRPQPPAATPPTVSARVRGQLLALLGILSFLAYWNFGAFHYGNYVHHHELFHYYVGSKYFDELSYTRLYDCACVAEAESPAMRRRVELRRITDLRTNVLVGTDDLLSHPEACKQHFTPSRWAEFSHDVAFFRDRLGMKRWEEALQDHGYNATPVWHLAGNLLANLNPMDDAHARLLTRLDPLFVVAMAGMIAWAFGWRVLCVALAVFATNFPSRFYWTGGAFLRWDWLFHMTAGVCLIKKGRPVLGGYLVGVSALLRVFPGLLLLGPIFALLGSRAASLKALVTPAMRGRRDRPPDPLPGPDARPHLRVLLGAALAAATLVPASLPQIGGLDGYRAFVQNSRKHMATPLTNYMGWKTVVSYRPDEAGRFLRTDRLDDVWRDWKDARIRTYHRRRWLYLAGVLGFAALLYRAVRGRSAWEATALGATAIAVIPELTCYFYAFLIVPALLWAEHRKAGLWLLAVTAATGFIDWAPTQFLPHRFPWTFLQMPTWLDEQYTWMSVVTLVGLGFLLHDLGRRPANEVETGHGRQQAGCAGHAP